MRRWRTRSEEETREVGAALAGELAPNRALLLFGHLGAGKTVLVRGLAAGLGLDDKEIQSPSFTLIREHGPAAKRLVHVDLYRLETGEVEALGLEEILAGPGVKAVEWAERLPFPVPGALELRLERPGGGGECEITEEGESG